MSKGENQKKLAYFEKVRTLFRQYSRIFVVNVDNVSSSQMHQIRASLRGKAIILMGKNTMVRKAMRDLIVENPKLEAILPCIRGNVGLVFTDADLKTVRDIMVSNRVQSAAKVGLVGQSDIYIPAGNTGIDPNKTSFFQALGIATKVVKGAIEITSDVLIVKTGQKVGPSEATLMNMLNLAPFTFGLTVLDIYDDGQLFSPAMLDITDDVLTKHLLSAIKNVAAVSLQTGIPTAASVPHSFINAFKKVVSVGLATDYSFAQADKIKERMAADVATASAAPAAASAKAAPAAAAAAAPAAPESEEDEEMGFGLFD